MAEIKPGWVWVERKGGFRPFVEFRQIIKGKRRGMVEVTLPAVKARKVIVETSSIRSYPIKTYPVMHPGPCKEEL